MSIRVGAQWCLAAPAEQAARILEPRSGLVGAALDRLTLGVL